MAADLHIHILEGATEQDIALFFTNTMGSKYFNPQSCGVLNEPRIRASRERIYKTPSVWIGEVSWLKAALSEDAETFVPSTVASVSETIGEDLPVIDQPLIEKILAAFDLPNNTGYGLATKKEVAEFFNKYLGKRAFTISW
jgi:hypothetical protein